MAVGCRVDNPPGFIPFVRFAETLFCWAVCASAGLLGTQLGSQVNEMGMTQAGMNVVTQTTEEVQPPLHHPVGFGLPCLKCRIYYGADLDACPLCQCRERVSPFAGSAPWGTR
jgi:hypothetical protein